MKNDWTPEIVLMETLRASALACSCGVRAVVPLTEKQRAKQPDATTHVCHPALGGCNQGFEKEGWAAAK